MGICTLELYEYMERDSKTQIQTDNCDYKATHSHCLCNSNENYSIKPVLGWYTAVCVEHSGREKLGGFGFSIQLR